jgi:hypothetical protein
VDKVSVAVLAALIVLAPLGYGVYHFSQDDDSGDEIIEENEEVIDHSAHDHPMEVRIQWTMESAEGISSGANLATDLDGSWSG